MVEWRCLEGVGSWWSSMLNRISVEGSISTVAMSVSGVYL